MAAAPEDLPVAEAEAVSPGAPHPQPVGPVEALRIVQPTRHDPLPCRVLEIVRAGGAVQHVGLTADGVGVAEDPESRAIAGFVLDSMHDESWDGTTLKEGLGEEVRRAEQELLASREEVAILRQCVKRLLPHDANDKLSINVDRLPVEAIPLSVEKALRRANRSPTHRLSNTSPALGSSPSYVPLDSVLSGPSATPAAGHLSPPVSPPYAPASPCERTSPHSSDRAALSSPSKAQRERPIETLLCSGLGGGLGVGRVRPRRPRTADPGAGGVHLRYLKKLDRSSQTASVARLYNSDVERRRRNLLRRKENQKQALQAQWGRGTLSKVQQNDLAQRLCTAQQEKSSALQQSLKKKYTPPPEKGRALDKEGQDNYCQRMFYSRAEQKKDRQEKLWARYVVPLSDLAKTAKLTPAQIAESALRLTRRPGD
eukprot:TRINITY_DN30407_c0_g1_i1.p1 TRINITY_DN30407_c0_g1~~TRINITY_DN30407_c0_g1_i1.p1  ORF type:complete len:444 (+),score=159.04 TRINITY_DN30407_c0_g1_i1:54-1334(+)